MKFYFDNREWDTDTPLYILGYQTSHYWGPIDSRRPLMTESPNFCCRKEYISKVVFAHEGDRSWVENFILTSKDGYDNLNYKTHIIATSVKKAMAKYEELLQKKKEVVNK